MRIFNRSGKINFVDENNVFVGYDTAQQCCETHWWTITEEPEPVWVEPTDEIGEGLSCLLDQYYFKDTAFERFDIDGSGSDSVKRAVRFTLESDKNPRILYLHLYNMHNGYYTHMFSVNTEPEAVNSDELFHKYNCYI